MIVSKLEAAQSVSFWNTFEPGVQEIFLLSEGKFGWQPADVFRALKGKEAQACFVYDGEDRVGWMIYRYLFGPDRQPFLHLWLLWGDPKRRGKLKEVEKFCAEWLGREAKKHNCKYVEADSNRLGWMRDAPKVGFKPHRMVYRMEV